MIFKTQAILDGYTPRKDGSMSIRFVTQEMSKLDVATMIDYYNTFGWLLFAASDMQESDIPDEHPTKEGKSPSQRLRSRLFVFFKEKGIEGSFDVFYEQQLEKIGNQYLERID